MSCGNKTVPDIHNYRYAPNDTKGKKSILVERENEREKREREISRIKSLGEVGQVLLYFVLFRFRLYHFSFSSI